MKMRVWIIFGIMIIVALLVYGLHSLTVASDKVLPREIAAMKDRTVPPNEHVLHESGIDRKPTLVEASWEFETGLNWLDYRSWVEKQLRGWRQISSTGNALEFGRQLTGDSEFLWIEQIHNGQRQAIKVTFRSQPD